MSGFIPRVRILTEPGLLYTAIGILGATVMPHNLFLHSAIVQTRNYPRTAVGAPAYLVLWTVRDFLIGSMFRRGVEHHVNLLLTASEQTCC